MAGRYNSATRYQQSRILFTLFLFFLSLSVILLTSSSSSSSILPRKIYAARNPNVDYSFVSSLQTFLLHSRSNPSSALRRDVTDQHVKNLDDLISLREERNLYGGETSIYSPLKVYVYDMPAKFTYDLLWLFHNTYKETTNLTSNGSPVHRLIEQHSIDYWLWADLIAPESERLLKNVVRVHKQDEADFFYIPFFTTISFFLLEKQQCRALYRVKPWSGSLTSQLGSGLRVEITSFLFIILGHLNLFESS